MICNINLKPKLFSFFEDRSSQFNNLKDIYDAVTEKNKLDNFDKEANFLIFGAEFYKEKSKIDTSFPYDESYDVILDLSKTFKDDITSFIKNARKLFDKSYKDELSTLESSIANIRGKLITQDAVVTSDVNSFIEALNNYVLSLSFNLVEADKKRQEVFNSYRDQMISVLSSVDGYQSFNRSLAALRTPEVENDLLSTTTYQDLKKILEEERVVLTVLKDGRVTLGISEETGVNIYDENGNLEEFIGRANIAQQIDIVSLYSEGSYLAFPLTDSLIYSGLDFVYKNLDETSKLILQEFYSNPSGAANKITITAHKTINPNNVLKHIENKREDFKNPGIISFQSNEQSAYLSREKNYVISNAIPQDYFFTLKVKATGATIVIKTLDDLAKVDFANNSIPAFANTTSEAGRVVIANENRDYFSKIVSVKNPDGTFSKEKQGLTTEDLVKLYKGHRNLSAFKKRVLTRATTPAYISRDSFDITEDFLEFFSLTVRPSNQKVSVSEYSSTRPRSVFEFDVAILDEMGNIKNQSKRKLPLLFQKVPSGVASFIPMSPLNRNERIIYKGKAYTYEAYIDNILKIDVNKLSPVSSNAGLMLESTLESVTPENIKSGQFSIRYVNRLNASENIGILGSFVNKLLETREEALDALATGTVADRNAVMMRFSQNFFNLQYYENTKVNPASGIPTGALYANISLSKDNKLQLEFRGYTPEQSKSKQGIFSKAIENIDAPTEQEREEGQIKNKTTFIIPEGLVQTLKDLFNVDNEYIRGINPEAFRGIKKDDPYEVFKRLHEIKIQGKYLTPQLKEYFSLIETANYELGRFIQQSFLRTLDAITEGRRGAYYNEIFKIEFPIKDGVFTNYVDTPSGKFYIPLIHPKGYFNSIYYNDLSNYYVTETYVNNKLEALATFEIGTAAEEARIKKEIESPSVTTPAPVVSTTGRKINVTTKKRGGGNTILSTAATPTEQRRINEQITYIKSLLPQFEIKEEDLADILEGMSEDVSVFGAFADKVIYLDKNLKGSGVVFHEAFHGVFRHLLDNNRRAELVTAVKNNKKYKDFFTDEYRKEFARKRKITNTDVIDNLIAEEILADGFQEYTLSRKKAGIFAKLYDFIMKLISMFTKNQAVINRLYRQVNNGYFTESQISSNLYDGQIAFKLVKGAMTLTNEDARVILTTPEDQEVNLESTVVMLSSRTQRKLITSMATQMLNTYDSRLSFEENFQRSRMSLLEHFDIENLISQNPEKRREILKKYGNEYYHFHFILSAGTEFQNRTMFTGLLDYTPENAEFIDNPPSLPEDLTGIEDLEEIKRQVKKKMRSFIIKSDLVQQEISDVIDELQREGITEDELNPEDFINDVEEEIESSLPDMFESTLYGINVLTSMSAEFKNFFSTISFTTRDEELGIDVPVDIDGSWAFNAFLKMSADVDPDNILQTVSDKIESLRYDGRNLEYQRMKTIFDRFLQVANVDPNTLEHIPGKSSKFYYEFLETFHVASTNSVSIRQNKLGKISYRSIDQTLEVDAASKSRQILSDMVAKVRRMHEDEAYIERLLEARGVNTMKELLSFYKLDIDKISNKFSKDTFILPITSTPDQALENEVTILKEALDFVGLDFPRSFIRFSILAIEKFENKSSLKNYENTEGYKYFMANYEDAYKGRYLNKKFLESVSAAIYAPLIKGETIDKVHTTISNRSSKNRASTILQTRLRNAFMHLVEKDFFELQSMVIDTERKPRYRYSKYTPFKIITNQIKKKGLLEYIKSTDHYSEYMKDWYQDHPFVQILQGDNEEAKTRLNLILSNMDISTNMGIDFLEGRKNIDGKTFKSMDRQSHYLTDIINYINATQVFDFKNDQTYSIALYKRSLGQLEGSRTNFLINSPIRRFIGPSGLRSTYEYGDANYESVIGNVLPFVKQEYQRIYREGLKRQERLERHLDKVVEGRIVSEKNLINEFNAKNKPKDVSRPEEEDIYNSPREHNSNEKDPLRAYEFGNLGKMFASEYQTVEDVNNSNLSSEDKKRLKKVVGLRETLRKYALGLKDSRITDSKNQLEAPVSFDELPKKIKDQLSQVIGEQLDYELKKYIFKLAEVGLVSVTKVVNLEDGRQEVIQLNQNNNLPEILKYLRPSEILPSAPSAKDVGFNILKTYADVNNIGVYARLLSDKFYNDYVNSLSYTQLFDGDFNMSVKDLTTWIKRAKQYVASGQAGKKGFYRAAVVPAIKVYINEAYPQLGEFDTMYEAKLAVYEAYENGLLDVTPEDAIAGFSEIDVFDGQAVTSIMHQIISFEQIGRLSSEDKDILIKSAYAELSPKEREQLKKNRVILNSKKTVHASSATYLKHSEHVILRSDVSVPSAKYNADPIAAEERLNLLYTQIYTLKSELNDRYELLKKNPELVQEDIFKDAGIIDLEKQIKNLATEAHSYFGPKLGKRQLYDLLNEMEVNNVDYMSDTNASKRATLLPEAYDKKVDTENEPAEVDQPGILINLPLDMRFKFLQIETSRIKEKVKASVQHKMLIAANREFLMDILNLESDGVDRGARIDEIFDDYLDTLRDIVKYKTKIFEKIMFNDQGTFDKIKLYNIIRESLIDRDADPNLIKLFEVVNGEPVYSSYLPTISNTLKFYYYSSFSKNVTEEQTSGGKLFHVSSWGRKIIVASEDIAELEINKGDIIRSEVYYENENVLSGRVTVRNLKIDYDSNTNTYWVEALVPKPLFRNKKEEEFWLENITKMFGTRIPTEDKRSMIAFKIVDFIDGAYMNSVVVPQMVHVMAGSDFDIDTLFTQSFNYFMDSNNDPVLYGTAITDEDKYKEYLFYMRSQEYVNERLQAISQEMDIDEFVISEELKETLKVFVGDDYVYLTDTLIPEAKKLRKMIEEGWASRDVLKEKYIRLVEMTTYENPYTNETMVLFDLPEFEQRVKYGKQLAREKTKLKRLEEELIKKDMLIQKAIDVFYFTEALRKTNLPVTFEEFNAEQAYNYVIPAIQNQNLRRKLDILSNADVFENMYYKERAESSMFKKMMEVLGRSLESISSEYDMHTATAHIESKAASSSAAQGIGIAANMNKFLALNSLENLELTDENVIWKIRYAGKDVVFNRYGTSNKDLPENTKRAIAIVGETLGMFTDALKKPIPAALRINDHNAAALLGMFGLNIPPQFAVMLLQIKQVREAIPINPQGRVYFNSVLENKIAEMLKDNELWAELSENVLEIRSSKRDNGSLRLNDKYIIDYQEVEETIANNEDPSLASMGIRVYMKNGKPLSENAQRVILMTLLSRQAAQQIEIYRVGSLMDMFKKLKPDFIRTANTLDTIKRLKENKSLFKNSAKMFEGDKIWTHFEKIASLIIDKSEGLYITENAALKPFFESLTDSFREKGEIANRLLMHFAVLRFIKTYNLKLENPEDAEEVREKAIRRDALRMFTDPRYWFDLLELPTKEVQDLFEDAGFVNSMSEDINTLRELFPNNQFLNYLILNENYDSKVNPKVAYPVSATGSKYSLADDLNLNIGFKFPQMVSKIKINNLEDATTLSDAFEEMYYSSQDVKDILERLILNEIARTGLQKMPNTFLDKINPELAYKPISDALNEVVQFMLSLHNKPVSSKDAFASLSEFFLNYNSPEAAKSLVEDLINVSGLITVKEGTRIRRPYRIIGIDEYISRGIMKAPEGSTSYNTHVDQLLSTLLGEYSFSYLTNIVNKKVTILSTKSFENRISNQEKREEGIKNNFQFSINLSSELPHLNIQGRKALANDLGFQVIEDKDQNLKGFKFPMFYQTYTSYNTTGRVFRVVSINGKKIEDLMLESIITGKTESILVGDKVVYELVDAAQGNENFNPIGKSKKFLKDLHLFSSPLKVVELKEENLERNENNIICKIKPFKS